MMPTTIQQAHISFFDFYDSDSEGVVIVKITQVRNFINEITK